MSHFDEGKMMLTEIRTLTTRNTFLPGAENLFRVHGCKIDKDPKENKASITFPEGTTKEEIFPRTGMEKNKIVLPDGWCLLEVFNHYNGISKLSEVPPEEVEKLQTEPIIPIARLLPPNR
jgi:hypothetical protein